MRKTITALIAAASAALMISGAGIAAASTRAAAAKTEHFQEMVASPTSSKANVIVYGAFTAAGVDVENANNTDTFKFPGGSFLVTPKFTRPNEHLNKATCLLTRTGASPTRSAAAPAPTPESAAPGTPRSPTWR